MCGRLTLVTPNPDVVAEYLGADWKPEDKERYKPRFNIPPTTTHPIVTVEGAARRLSFAKWGLERVIGKNADGSFKTHTPFNSMVESLDKKTWRKAFQERRCIIPATGFYEWVGSKKERRPLHFTRRDGELLLLAGIFDWPSDDRPLSFSVLTTTANSTLSPFHDRMPVILEPGAVATWLAHPAVELLRPAGDGVLAKALANTRVNKVGNEGPECLVPEDGPAVG